ncbi:unnamed protein product [Adineta ricciae]|uniref:Tetraspanin n=1 Tax=Adineta ricciae TaxID=249248 RepID=A0A814LA75_ADIRI|nr:unnamed protein product [Adineta ricciae]CAF1607109.1 unnamed protein product [Adineta ricciae]
MKSGPVTITSMNATSTPARRTLFRIALVVALSGTIAVSTILILHGGIAFGRLRYFVDIGQHPLHITGALLLFFGLLSLVTFIIISVGIVKVNKTLAVLAAVLIGVCSLGLIAFSIWSFLALTSGQLPASINNTIVKELDETRFSYGVGNTLIVDNTNKMARLEKQYRCCGLADPIDDYRSRQQSSFGSLNPSSSSSGGSGGGARSRTTSTQRNSAASNLPVLLPISCCNKKYLSADNLCVDMFGNNTSPINRYYTNGCYPVVARYKFERIQRQGFTTIVAACLAVISCIALAAVVRLLGEGYQVIPLRVTT